MTKKFRLVSSLFVLAALALSGLGVRYATAAPTQQAAGTNYTAMVGAMAYTEGEGSKPSWQMLKFYPDSITVNVGDSITWKFNSGAEPHTVTFLGTGTQLSPDVVPDPTGGPGAFMLDPLVFLPAGGATYDGTAYANSGIIAQGIPGPQEYKLTFTKAGTYDYYCELHAFQMPDGSVVGMKAKVVVQDAGTAVPKTPEQVMVEAEAGIAADKALAVETEATLDKSDKTTPGPNGTLVHQVTAGYMDMQKGIEYQRFYPKTVNVNPGDTVEWTEPTGGFHTVTFGEEPEIFILEPQQNGPPKAKINPLFFPAGGSTNTGTGYYNSGPMAGPMDPPEAGVKSYSLTFTQSGRYEYICIPHYPTGMDATIVVMGTAGGTSGGDTGGGDTSGGTPPGMPRTGDSNEGSLFGLALFAGLALTGAGVALRKRALI